MSRPAIEFDGVWKKFKKGEDYDSLRDLIPAIARRLFLGAPSAELRQREFWALKDFSFQVAKGEAIGIIGHNGSGKSTTLKLLSGVLAPNKGSIKINGRLSALIEIGAGFHPDLTGRENVFLNGTILGLTRSQVQNRFDAIVEFSEIREFIDTPVKRYSSGMYARLGFSVAAHLDPDILLVDEVLSVGDISFQQKCLERIKQLERNGTTIIFISHNMEAVQDLCSRVILLEHGVKDMEGDAASVVKAYRERSRFRAEPVQNAEEGMLVDIEGVRLLDQGGNATNTVERGDDFSIRIKFKTLRRIPQPVVGFNFFHEDGTRVFGHNNRMDSLRLADFDGTAELEVRYQFVNLQPGRYRVSVDVTESSGMRSYIHSDKALEFTVRRTGPWYVGVVEWPHTWIVDASLLHEPMNSTHNIFPIGTPEGA